MQNGQRRHLIDIIVETICRCRDDPGENVQLQVLKALLTIVSSNVCKTHGESLLLAVRACYHIYLVSKNPVNRSTAKASLTQILSVVFQRMETEQTRIDSSDTPVANAVDGASAANSASSLTESLSDADGAAVPDVPDSTASSTVSSPGPVAGVSQTGDVDGDGDDAASFAGFLTASHRDAFLIFRALCKLSMKGDDGSSSDDAEVVPEAIALQSKILSLELLLLVLERSGMAFRSGPKFIEVIRKVRAYVFAQMPTNLIVHLAIDVADCTPLSRR